MSFYWKPMTVDLIWSRFERFCRRASGSSLTSLLPDRLQTLFRSSVKLSRLVVLSSHHRHCAMARIHRQRAPEYLGASRAAKLTVRPPSKRLIRICSGTSSTAANHCSPSRGLVAEPSSGAVTTAGSWLRERGRMVESVSTVKAAVTEATRRVTKATAKLVRTIPAVHWSSKS